ncbi:transposase [Sulfurimonas sp. NWX79]|uniref:transposase n=1 Tax=Sulfurimonas sp. NWX79 TaxID=2925412 RepID=UPI003204EA44
MQWLEKCLWCQGYVYILNDNRIKCSQCNKKISRNKINKIFTIIEAYINNESALQLANRMQVSYTSIHSYYEELRFLCANISEKEYEKYRNINCEYEEYFYLEKSKKNEQEAVFDAHNFLTFDYNGHIYTLLLPSLHKYKNKMIEDSIESTYLHEFNKFKRISRLIKVSKHHNNIVQFWDYFEKSIIIYKGIKSDHFIYFLKEFEFKYNHSKDEAINLLISEYFKV